MVDENSRTFGEEFGLKSQKSRMATENSTPTPPKSSAVKRKVLAEKNNGSCSPTRVGVTMQAKPKVNLRGDGVEVCSDPYDPMTNYTSPRPQFLRYNPNRRREILMRIEGEKSKEEDESGGSSSLSSEPEKPDAEGPLSIPSNCSQPSVEEEVSLPEIDMDEEEEDVEKRPRCLKTAWNLFLIVVLLFSNYYFSSMRPGSGPSLQDHRGDFVEGFAKTQRDQAILPGNLMAKIFGLSEVCFNVPSKQLICGVEYGLQEHESIHGIELVEGATGQLLIGEKIHEAVSSIEQTILPGNLMAKIFGLSEVCFNVPSKQLICGVEYGLQEHESIHGIELVEGATGQLLIGEKIHEAASSTEQSYHEILDPHSKQTVNSPRLLSDSSQASAIESVALNSSNGQDGIFYLEEEAQGMKASVTNESLWFPWFQTYSRMVSDTPKLEENEVESIFVFSSQNAPHILLSIYVLASSLGYFLHKSFLGYRKNTKPPSTSTKSAVRDKFMPSTARKKKKIENKITGAGVCSASPSCPSNLAGALPTVVQSLGEFTVFERTTKRKADSAELSQLSQYSRRSTRKNFSPIAKEELPCLPDVSSVVEAIPTTFQNQLMEENPGFRTDAMKMTPTPLRRSNRLRSRVALTLR